MEIDVPAEADALRIHAPHYKGALISAAIDGECVGKIVYQPYDLLVEDVKPGKHTVELTLFGNRHNSFGPVHSADRGLRWYGPNAWVTRDDAFSYEYNLREMGILRSPEIIYLKTDK